jgi:hypothetical protein
MGAVCLSVCQTVADKFSALDIIYVKTVREPHSMFFERVIGKIPVL